MKLPGLVFLGIVVLPMLVTESAIGQSTFQNLDFEQSTIVSSSPSGYGFNTGTANVPGWTEYNGWADVNYSGGTTLIYNNQPLDSPGVCLEGTDYSTPAIDGNYSILLYGGSSGYGGAAKPAAIGQTGQIPPTAQSIIYWGVSGNGLQITFNGQTLSFGVINTTAHYTVYAANIAAYAGQTGQLLFTAPWKVGYGMVDDIQFSDQPAPEPTALTLLSISGLCLGWRFKRPRQPKG
jgi:hypothetical protein